MYLQTLYSPLLRAFYIVCLDWPLLGDNSGKESSHQGLSFVLADVVCADGD